MDNVIDFAEYIKSRSSKELRDIIDQKFTQEILNHPLAYLRQGAVMYESLSNIYKELFSCDANFRVFDESTPFELPETSVRTPMQDYNRYKRIKQAIRDAIVSVDAAFNPQTRGAKDE